MNGLSTIVLASLCIGACSSATTEVAEEAASDPEGSAAGSAGQARADGGAGGQAGRRADAGASSPGDARTDGTFRMGLITDEHFGQATWGLKSPGYVSDAMAKMAPWQPDVIASLGDTCDGEWDETKLRGYYDDFSTRARVAGADRAFVEGNHDVSGVYIDVMLAAWPADVVARFEPGTMFGSFDRNGVHVIMLDAEYVNGVEPGDHKAFAGTSGPGYVPRMEIDWLAADLAATTLPAIVLSHEPIGSGNSVTNAAAVRASIEASQKVVACFAGHAHKNAHVEVNGINYFTITTIGSDSGYTAHDLGTHAQATFDPAARRLVVETYENDSSKGYQLAHTEPVAYTIP